MAQEEPTRENPCGPIGNNVIFENEYVRVWDLKVGPHGRKPWHEHKLPYLIVGISGGKVEIENVAGQIYHGQEKAGSAIWRDPGERHELRNMTDAPYQNVLVEIKQPAKL